jgi:NitT/TauT family transport system substrate-binding protein
MRAGRHLGRIAIALLICSGCRKSGADASTTGGADEASIALPSTSLTFAPVYIASDKGFWKDAGVNVSVRTIEGIQATNAVLAGNVDFANIVSPTMLKAQASGQKLVAIANTQDRVQVEIVVSKAFQERVHLDAAAPASERARLLRGARVAVDAPKSFVHNFVVYVARRGGLDPERDFVITPIAPPAMLAALRSGQIDAFAIARPWTSIARKSDGAATLVSGPRGDFPELTPFNYNLLVTRPGFCESKPTVCRKVVRGLKQSLGFLRQQPKDAAALLRPRFDKTDPDMIEETIVDLAAGAPETTSVGDEGFRHALDFMVGSGMIQPSEKGAFTAPFTNAYSE